MSSEDDNVVSDDNIISGIKTVNDVIAYFNSISR